MTRTISHQSVVAFHKHIADSYIGINGFYRFNWNEINGNFREGVGMPTLLLESHSSELESISAQKSTFNSRRISFMLLDFAGVQNDFDKQEEVLDNLENIGLDIISYCQMLNKKPDSWLYGKFDVNSVTMEKVGPIFDNMYGWNILYTLKNFECMKFDAQKWNFQTDSE